MALKRNVAADGIFVVLNTSGRICDLVVGRAFSHTLDLKLLERYYLQNILHPADVPYVTKDIRDAAEGKVRCFLLSAFVLMPRLQPTTKALFRVWSIRGFYSPMEARVAYILRSAHEARMVYSITRSRDVDGHLIDPEEWPLLNVYDQKVRLLTMATAR